jgi:hypothetical protein
VAALTQTWAEGTSPSPHPAVSTSLSVAPSRPSHSTAESLSRSISASGTLRKQTPLGPARVTTPEQTILDLAHRPTLADDDTDVPSAITALLPRAERRTGSKKPTDADERDTVAAEFGVAPAKVERDTSYRTSTPT